MPQTAERSDLRDPWMSHAGAVLADEEIVAMVCQAIGNGISRAAVVTMVHRPRRCFARNESPVPGHGTCTSLFGGVI
jgi:hypothetical protein